jgi:hypothetical protein
MNPVNSKMCPHKTLFLYQIIGWKPYRTGDSLTTEIIACEICFYELKITPKKL